MKTFFKILILAVVLIAVVVGYEWSEKAGVWEGVLFPEFKVEKSSVDWKIEGVTSVSFKVRAKIKNKSGFEGERTVICIFTDSDGKDLEQKKTLRLKGEGSSRIVFEYGASLGKEALKTLRSEADLDSRYKIKFERGAISRGAWDRAKGILGIGS